MHVSIHLLFMDKSNSLEGREGEKVACDRCIYTHHVYVCVCVCYGCPGNCKEMTKRVRDLEIVVLLNGGEAGVMGVCLCVCV